MPGGKAAILEAAMRIFADKGYAAASTREICEAAGITKPALYHHFGSKEQLFHELVIDAFAYFHKGLLRSARAQGNLRERLINVTFADFRAARKDPVRVLFLLRMVFSPEERRPHFNYIEQMERERELLAGVFREGIESGELRGDPKRLATALMAMRLFAILENLFTGRATLTRRRAAEMVDLLLEGSVSG